MKLLKNKITFCMIAMFALIIIIFNVLFGTVFSVYSKNVRRDYSEKVGNLFERKIETAEEHLQTVFDLLMTKEYKADYSNNLLLQSSEKQEAAISAVKRDFDMLSDPRFYIDAVYVIGKDTNQLNYAYYTKEEKLDTSFSGIDSNDLLLSGFISEVYRYNKEIGYISRAELESSTEKFLARNIPEEKSTALKRLIAEIKDNLAISNYVGSEFVIAVINKEKVFGSVFGDNSDSEFRIVDGSGNTVYTNSKSPEKSARVTETRRVKNFTLLLNNKKFLTYQYYLTLIVTVLVLLPLFTVTAYKISRWMMLPINRLTTELETREFNAISTKNYSSFSIKSRILIPLISIFLIFYILLSLSSFCCAYALNVNQNRQISEVNDSIVKHNAEKFFYEPTQILPISYDDICRMTLQKDEYSMPEPYLLLKSGNENASKLDYFFITDKSGGLIYSSDSFDSNEINTLSYYAMPIIEKNSENRFFLYSDKTVGETAFWVKKLNGSGDAYGYIFMKLRDDVFESLLQNMQSAEITVTDSDNAVIYQSMPNTVKSSRYSDGDTVRIKGETYIVHPVMCGDFNMNIIYMQPKFITNKTLYRYINYFFIIAFAGLSLIMLTVIVFSNYISKKIYCLIDCMNKGEKYKGALPDNANEIHFLINTYNQMLERIDALTKKTILQEKHREKLLYLKTQAELIALRHQVNSHFIFNVLNIIHEDAVRNGNTVIADTVKALASMIRYSMLPEMHTTIKNELEIIEKYVFIQKTRFNSCFEYHTEIEDGVENIKVLRLMIQPLIENAIEHGLFNMSSGNVYLSIFKSDGLLYICVTDDGIGMYEQQAEELMKYISVSEEKAGRINADNRYGIALRNIYQRIKSYYGERADLTFETAFMNGTTVKLIIPLNDELLSEREKDDNE